MDLNSTAYSILNLPNCLHFSSFDLACTANVGSEKFSANRCMNNSVRETCGIWYPVMFIDKKLQKLEGIYGPHDVDLFASQANKQFNNYYNLFKDPKAVGVPDKHFNTTTTFSDIGSTRPEKLKTRTGPITTPQIAKILSSLYVKEKLNKLTIISYKSAILDLTSNPKGISNDTILKELISAINDSSIKKDLTSKLCWLLEVTGLLRASDIHRIADSKTKGEDEVLSLDIVAPKEKENRQPIKRPCQISGHLNPILLLVKTYQMYKTSVSTKECPTQHVNDDSQTINSLEDI
ncbi:hypothetical protein BB560_005953 [Smittium megazygosporum]|uniref:Uncharacterized protein n=1 Tax=Smittium megazygosporum TaxID=133381 RepID=A0A2T9YPF3_9FUNG|nr:hypothetical protein BB560_005953 [Smittium megazygosporum]